MVPKQLEADAPAQLERIDTGMTTDSNSSVAGPLSDVRPEENENENIPKKEGEEDAAFEVEEGDDLTGSKPKKRRKMVKNSDKKYQCPHPECTKTYSRAEHLYRHQLNRTSCSPRLRRRPS